MRLICLCKFSCCNISFLCFSLNFTTEPANKIQQNFCRRFHDSQVALNWGRLEVGGEDKPGLTERLTDRPTQRTTEHPRKPKILSSNSSSNVAMNIFYVCYLKNDWPTDQPQHLLSFEKTLVNVAKKRTVQPNTQNRASFKSVKNKSFFINGLIPFQPFPHFWCEFVLLA